MNAVATIPPMPIMEMQTLAVAIAKSGLFGIRTPEQALVLMAIAQAEGRHPVEAARDYDIINNRPAKKAEAMMRDFIQAGGKIEWHELSDERADATFTHPQTGSVRIDWDMKRAMTAFGKKDMYAKFPRQMLRSRVVSEGVRTLWPLATSGLYVPEEVADMPAKEHNGPTLEHTDNVREGDAREVGPPSGRDALNAAIPLKAAAADMPRPPKVADPEVYETPPKSTPKRTRGEFLEGLSIALRDAQSAEEVDKILCSEDVMRAKEVFYGDLKERLDRLISRALEKWWPEPPAEQDDLPEIVGEERVGAG